MSKKEIILDNMVTTKGGAIKTVGTTVGLVAFILSLSGSMAYTIKNESIHQNIQHNITAIKKGNTNDMRINSAFYIPSMRQYDIEISYDLAHKKFVVTKNDMSKPENVQQITDYIRKNADKSVQGVPADKYFADILTENPKLANYGYALLELQRMNIYPKGKIAKIITIPIEQEKGGILKNITEFKDYTDVRHVIVLKDGQVFRSPNLVNDIKQNKLVVSINYWDKS